MYLLINTTHPEKLIVQLISAKSQAKLEHHSKTNQASEKLLKTIDKLLKQEKFKLKNLTGLIVVKGPGRFSALRVGVLTANTLAYTLNLPVLGIKANEALCKLNYKDLARKLAQIKIRDFVEPEYGKEPNIT